jgi:hypothetical protein
MGKGLEMKKAAFSRVGFVLLLGSFAAAPPAHGDPHEYAVVLETLGRDGISAERLDQIEAHLIATGTPAREARAALLLVIRSVRVPAEKTEQIVILARDVGAVMGTGIVGETSQLAGVLASNNYEAVDRYASARNAGSPADFATMRAMLQHGDWIGATGIFLGVLEAQFGGRYEALRSPAEKALSCGVHSAENIAQFRGALAALHAGSAGTPSELQKAVVNLCAAGQPERDAFARVMSILRGQ